jgi:O-acetyl-ADP-ribose deacetylase (regulator of RNase III)
MKRGIALAIHEQFPEAFEADCRTAVGDRAKLGTFTSVEIVRPAAQFTIVNAYTQFHWQGTGVLVDYDAVRSAFGKVKQQYSGQRIGYPKIGAGLAHGDWNVLSAIIEEELAGEDHTLVEFVP